MVLLAHQKTDAKLILEVDAPDIAVGRKVSQTVDEELQPLAFFS